MERVRHRRCCDGEVQNLLRLPASLQVAVDDSGRERIPTDIGRLGDVLEQAVPGLALVEGSDLARGYLVSINAGAFVRDTGVPIGPGDRVQVIDAASGG